MVRIGAIDVGGTTVKAGVVGDDDEFTPLGVRRATPYGADAVIDLVCELAADMQAADDIDAVGVVVPGVVDDDTGTGVWSANLGWHQVPFRSLLARGIGLPVAFGHDVRAGGLAEARWGAGRGVDDLIFMPIGTGIAAALIFGGQVYAGSGWAGEIGHVDVGHPGTCACGRTGCLEAIASGSAIARRYAQRSHRHVSGAEAVAALVREGDPDATRVWGDALDGLASALAWTTSVLAPQVVVLGGGVALAGDDLLLDPLESRLADRLSGQRRPLLTRAVLGDSAGCIGAALAARDLIEANR